MRTESELSDLGTIRLGSALAVADQIQAFALGRKTGVLHIFHNGDGGKIFLLNGEVVDAVFGGRRGVVAAIDMINLPDPPTAFTLDEGTRFRTIQMSYVELLLDAARYQDEVATSNQKSATSDRLAHASLPGLKFWLHRREYVYRLDKPVIQIGRAKGNDLMILEPSVSREHARLERHDFGVMLHDLDSANGTYLAGHRIKDAILQTGDEIRLGQVPAKFIVAEVVEVSAAKPAAPLPMADPDPPQDERPAIGMKTANLPEDVFLGGIHFPVISATSANQMRRAS